MSRLFLLALCGITIGCAGSQTDRDFRSKVKSVTLSGSAAQTGETTSGTVVATFELRDPGDK